MAYVKRSAPARKLSKRRRPRNPGVPKMLRPTLGKEPPTPKPRKRKK